MADHSNSTGASVRASGLPALLDHLREMHTLALQVEAVLRAVESLEANDKRSDARMTLTEVAIDLARDLNNGLDSVHLPEVRA